MSPCPSFEDLKKNLPEGAKHLRIKWSLVCLGHSPDAGRSVDGRAADVRRGVEAGPGVRGTLFWVVTRELQCFY